MDPTDIDLFQLAERRLAWIDRRQMLLAQNVANANTPGYQARDIAPFSAALAGAPMLRTSALHLEGKSDGAPGATMRPRSRSPNGNGVALEDQLGRIAETSGQQELVINLHHRYQSMLRTALGRGS